MVAALTKSPGRRGHSPATRTKLTPPQLAEQWGISTDKVLTWIRRGELRAVNAAASLGGRPRYLIDVADVAAFEQRRAAKQTTAAKGRGRRRSADVIEYF